MKYSFEECLAHIGIIGLPEGLKPYYEAFCAEKEVEEYFICRKFITEKMEEYQISEKSKQRMLDAVEEIQSDEMLLWFTQFLVSDMCEARHRCDLDDYRTMEPEKIMKNKDLYSMLLLMACIEPSKERLGKLGVAEKYYAGIPDIPLKKQMKKYEETGNGNVDDFPWDMNFYTCSIFLFDRFYFIPYRLEDDIIVFRSVTENRSISFFNKKKRICCDGRIDSRQESPDRDSFETVFGEEGETIFGTPINPSGIVENKIIKLNKTEWKQVLQRGELLLGLHIPGGEGYTPKRLKTSTELARQFFDTYFSDMPIKGFGSESWLYDPHIRLFLKKESNICRMQDQMYIYPIESGDGQMWGELFGSTDRPPKKLETTLEKKVWNYIQEGGKMTPASMFLLYEDMDKIGGEIYCSAQTKETARKKLTNCREQE